MGLIRKLKEIMEFTPFCETEDCEFFENCIYSIHQGDGYANLTACVKSGIIVVECYDYKKKGDDEQ